MFKTLVTMLLLLAACTPDTHPPVFASAISKEAT